jgi:hypothetical protein
MTDVKEVFWLNGQMRFRKCSFHDTLHNRLGPAIEAWDWNGNSYRCEFYIYGISLSEEEFLSLRSQRTKSANKH